MPYWCGELSQKGWTIMMKTLNEKINTLYQSQKKDMGGKGLLWMALIFAILSGCFVGCNIFSDGVFIRVAFKYLIIVFAFLTMLSLFSYFYIYSKKKTSKLFTRIVIGLYKFFLIICFVICIPIIVFLKITEMILRYRAKKLDNLENWLIILVIDLSVIMILCHIDILIAKTITEFIFNFVKNQYNYNIVKYPLSLFLILCLFKAEVDFINMLILKVMNRFGISEIKKEISEKQKDKTYECLIESDIFMYIDKKNSDIREYEEKQMDGLRYDLAYQKKTAWKFQLLCLIVLFFLATFIPEILFAGHQGDAINVITVFTLIMLYIDKRKEWK